METQCTVWMAKDLILRLGKVAFFDNSISHNAHTVPNPKRIVGAFEWCRYHAAKIDGFVRENNGKVAVFRDVV